MQTAETKGKSQELAMTVRGIYYIKGVYPAHLRLIGLFTGEERTLPREYCVKLSLDNLSALQVQLQSLQLQKVSSSLFKTIMIVTKVVSQKISKVLTRMVVKSWQTM